MSIFLLKDFPDIDFCVTLLLCMLRSALQVVIPLILSGIDETNGCTVTEQGLVFDLSLYSKIAKIATYVTHTGLQTKNTG